MGSGSQDWWWQQWYYNCTQQQPTQVTGSYSSLWQINSINKTVDSVVSCCVSESTSTWLTARQWQWWSKCNSSSAPAASAAQYFTAVTHFRLLSYTYSKLTLTPTFLPPDIPKQIVLSNFEATPSTTLRDCYWLGLEGWNSGARKAPYLLWNLSSPGHSKICIINSLE